MSKYNNSAHKSHSTIRSKFLKNVGVSVDAYYKIIKESEQSQRLWQLDNNHNVPLTRYAKLILSDLFPASLMLDNIRLIAGGVKHRFYKLIDFMNTRAFALGNNIYSLSAAGDYPGGFNQLGKNDLCLLAHELTHTVQEKKDGLFKFLIRYGIPKSEDYGIEPFLPEPPDNIIGNECDKFYARTGLMTTYDNWADLNAYITKKKLDGIESMLELLGYDSHS